MRHRERVLRVAAETAEKMGLDPRNKEVIDSILLNKPQLQELDATNNSSKETTEEKEEVVLKEEAPPKKKNPFPPKKKKVIEATETATEKTATVE